MHNYCLWLFRFASSIYRVFIGPRQYNKKKTPLIGGAVCFIEAVNYSFHFPLNNIKPSLPSG